VITSEEGVVQVEMADAVTGNALSPALVLELEGALRALTTDASLRAMVLTGRGPTFCSGAPRELLEKLCDGSVSPAEIRLPARLLEFPIPIIAAVSGHAVGGGFALALSADITILSEECRYGFNFTDLGFTPGMGTTRLAELTLGPALARELLLTGELRRGREFSAHVPTRPRAEVLAHARDLARRIADKPGRATSLLKRALAAPRRRAFEEALAGESLMHELTFFEPGTRELIKERYGQ
jgi:4-carboxy-3-alkylbut-2-enoyl-[acp] decarboxylase